MCIVLLFVFVVGLGCCLTQSYERGDRTNHSRIKTMKNRTLAATLGISVITTIMGLGVSPASAAILEATLSAATPFVRDAAGQLVSNLLNPAPSNPTQVFISGDESVFNLQISGGELTNDINKNYSGSASGTYTVNGIKNQGLLWNYNFNLVSKDRARLVGNGKNDTDTLTITGSLQHKVALHQGETGDNSTQLNFSFTIETPIDNTQKNKTVLNTNTPASESHGSHTDLLTKAELYATFIHIQASGNPFGECFGIIRETCNDITTWRSTIRAEHVVVVVPEPSTTLSLLALGTLGAASTLKRKLKSSKSSEKETTKVS